MESLDVLISERMIDEQKIITCGVLSRLARISIVDSCRNLLYFSALTSYYERKKNEMSKLNAVYSICGNLKRIDDISTTTQRRVMLVRDVDLSKVIDQFECCETAVYSIQLTNITNLNMLYAVDMIDEDVEWDANSAAIRCKEAQLCKQSKELIESDGLERRGVEIAKLPSQPLVDNRKTAAPFLMPKSIAKRPKIVENGNKITESQSVPPTSTGVKLEVPTTTVDTTPATIQQATSAGGALSIRQQQQSTETFLDDDGFIVTRAVKRIATAVDRDHKDEQSTRSSEDTRAHAPPQSTTTKKRASKQPTNQTKISNFFTK